MGGRLPPPLHRMAAGPDPRGIRPAPRPRHGEAVGLGRLRGSPARPRAKALRGGAVRVVSGLGGRRDVPGGADRIERRADRHFRTSFEDRLTALDKAR